MKKITLLLLILFLTFYCGKNKETYREQITKTFANGKPEILCKYSRDSGVEKLVEIVTYNENGQVIIIENPLTKTRKRFLWHENGRKKSETNLQAGKIHGRWVKWYSNGSIKYDSVYHQGQLVHEASYAKTITGEKFYTDGRLSISREYKKGILALETFYRAGEVVKKIFFYPDGKKSDEREYKNGVLHGKSIYWDRDGKKRSETLYRDGKPEARAPSL